MTEMPSRTTVAPTGQPPCGHKLLWWDGDNEGAYVCALPAGHLTLHVDGPVTFDNDDVVECSCPRLCPLHPETLPTL